MNREEPKKENTIGVIPFTQEELKTATWEQIKMRLDSVRDFIKSLLEQRNSLPIDPSSRERLMKENMDRVAKYREEEVLLEGELFKKDPGHPLSKDGGVNG